MRNNMRTAMVTLVVAMMGFAMVHAGERPVTKLPAPKTQLGVDLMQALKARQAVREYDETRHIDDLETLSTILWACDGVNRPESKKRTAPFGMGINLVRVYVLAKEGVGLYNPDVHSVALVSKEDVRAIIGPAFAAKADVTLLFTLDKALAGRLATNERRMFDFAWNGFGAMGQNVALAAAAQGIGTVVVASVNNAVLTEKKLISDTEIPLAIMPLGYLKQ